MRLTDGVTSFAAARACSGVIPGAPLSMPRA
jgi:hypothetical protein